MWRRRHSIKSFSTRDASKTSFNTKRCDLGCHNSRGHFRSVSFQVKIIKSELHLKTFCPGFVARKLQNPLIVCLSLKQKSVGVLTVLLLRDKIFQVCRSAKIVSSLLVTPHSCRALPSLKVGLFHNFNVLYSNASSLS